jgi:hypothetical protein
MKPIKAWAIKRLGAFPAEGRLLLPFIYHEKHACNYILNSGERWVQVEIRELPAPKKARRA